MAAALQAVHYPSKRQNAQYKFILHGDIKKESFVLDRRGNLKLINFGLARFLRDCKQGRYNYQKTVRHSIPKDIYDLAQTMKDMAKVTNFTSQEYNYFQDMVKKLQDETKGTQRRWEKVTSFFGGNSDKTTPRQNAPPEISGNKYAKRYNFFNSEEFGNTASSLPFSHIQECHTSNVS